MHRDRFELTPDIRYKAEPKFGCIGEILTRKLTERSHESLKSADEFRGRFF